MDKLTLQTVYVPVDKYSRLYVKNGISGDVVASDVEVQDNRIVLTPQELLAIIDEFDTVHILQETRYRGMAIQ